MNENKSSPFAKTVKTKHSPKENLQQQDITRQLRCKDLTIVTRSRSKSTSESIGTSRGAAIKFAKNITNRGVTEVEEDCFSTEISETIESTSNNTTASPITDGPAALQTTNSLTFTEDLIISQTTNSSSLIEDPTKSLSTNSSSLSQTTNVSSPTQGKLDLELTIRSKMVVLSIDDKMKITEFVRGIPTFNGKRDSLLEESLNVFLTECKSAIEMFSEEQKTYFLSIIKNRFRGEALVLINNKKFETFEELQNFLYLHYIPRKDPSEVIREINTIVQKVDENILAYSERLKSLVSLVESLLDQKYDTKDISSYKEEIVKQAIRQFKFGIRDYTIQTALFHEQCDTLDAVTEMALKWEKIENSRHSIKDIATPNTNSAKTDGTEAEIIVEKLLEKLSKHNLPRQELKSIHNPPNSYNQNNQVCEFCQRKGHLISECRTKKFTPFCNYCHRYYHTIQECPKKPSQNGNTMVKSNNNFRTSNNGNTSRVNAQQTGQVGFRQNGITYYNVPNRNNTQQGNSEHFRHNRFRETPNVRFIQQSVNNESPNDQGNEEDAICGPQIVNPNPM